jgi:dTDP-4-dehydrorhamnose reductase
MSRLQKIFITGSQGQVGQQLAKHAPAWADVTAINRTLLDLTNPQQIRECVRSLKPDIIINAAAYTTVDKAEEEPHLAHVINAEAIKILAEESETLNCRIVHYSTDYVFDGKASQPYAPDAKKNPQSIYGKSKSLGEDYLLSTAQLKNILLLRTAWVHAPAGKNFVSTMLKLMQTQPNLRVISDQIGTPTSAVNVATATWQALDKGVSGLHHFTDAGAASWYDFAHEISRLGHRYGRLIDRKPIEPILSHQYPQRALRPHFSLLDKASFWHEARLTPEHWTESLERSWFKDLQ